MKNPEETGTIRQYVRKNVLTGKVERAEVKNIENGLRTDSYYNTEYSGHGALAYCDRYGFKDWFNIPGHNRY